jgi:hypothetical protein
VIYSSKEVVAISQEEGVTCSSMEDHNGGLVEVGSCTCILVREVEVTCSNMEVNNNEQVEVAICTCKLVWEVEVICSSMELVKAWVCHIL